MNDPQPPAERVTPEQARSMAGYLYEADARLALRSLADQVEALTKELAKYKHAERILEEHGIVLWEKQDAPDQFDGFGFTKFKPLLEMTARVEQAEARAAAAEGLISHMWVHAGYPACGREQMTTEQKALYDRITGTPPAEVANEEVERETRWGSAGNRRARIGQGGICLDCGAWSPVGHSEAHDHYITCPSTVQAEVAKPVQVKLPPRYRVGTGDDGDGHMYDYEDASVHGAWMRADDVLAMLAAAGIAHS